VAYSKPADEYQFKIEFEIDGVRVFKEKEKINGASKLQAKHLELLNTTRTACRVAYFSNSIKQSSHSTTGEKKEEIVTGESTTKILFTATPEKALVCTLDGRILKDTTGTIKQIQYLLEFKSILQAQYGMLQTAEITTNATEALDEIERSSLKNITVSRDFLKCADSVRENRALRLP
jgi:hypothetical protein